MWFMFMSPTRKEWHLGDQVADQGEISAKPVCAMPWGAGFFDKIGVQPQRAQCWLALESYGPSHMHFLASMRKG